MSRRKPAKNQIVSEFHCVICDFKTFLPRQNEQRELGHIKDIWCVKCKDITQHLEFRDRNWDKYKLFDEEMQ